MYSQHQFGLKQMPPGKTPALAKALPIVANFLTTVYRIVYKALNFANHNLKYCNKERW